MEVHRALGLGFREGVYHEALAREFTQRQIPYEGEVPFTIAFKGKPLRTSYRADFVCYGEVLVELKALRALTGVELAQVLNYLRASRLERALLLNFGASSLEYRRIILSADSSAQSVVKSAQSVVKSAQSVDWIAPPGIEPGLS